MPDALSFRLNGEAVRLSVEDERTLPFQLRMTLARIRAALQKS
jgi:hypothetical protein